MQDDKPQFSILSNKEFITIKDLQECAHLKYDRAAKLMREIKSYSDSFNIAGRVHRSDYINYITRPKTTLTLK